MKKTYFSPEFEVVKIRVNMQLLTTSSGEANGNGEGIESPGGTF